MKGRLTAAQVAILKILWERGEATATEVQEALEVERRYAYSTVATMLARLVRRGLVRHRAEGRQFIYSAAVSDAETRAHLVEQVSSLADNLFDGDVAALVNQLLSARDVDPDELDRVRAMIDAHRKRREPEDRS